MSCARSACFSQPEFSDLHAACSGRPARSASPAASGRSLRQVPRLMSVSSTPLRTTKVTQLGVHVRESSASSRRRSCRCTFCRRRPRARHRTRRAHTPGRFPSRRRRRRRRTSRRDSTAGFRRTENPRHRVWSPAFPPQREARAGWRQRGREHTQCIFMGPSLTLDDVDGQAAARSFLVLGLHVGAGLPHGLDDLSRDT